MQDEFQMFNRFPAENLCQNIDDLRAGKSVPPPIGTNWKDGR